VTPSQQPSLTPTAPPTDVEAPSATAIQSVVVGAVVAFVLILAAYLGAMLFLSRRP
jgi:hypothetical protein